MSENQPPAPNAWRLDRTIPVAAIASGFLFVAGYTIASVRWASSMDTRMEATEKAIAAFTAAQVPNAERLTRVETNTAGMQRDIVEIKGDVKQLVSASRQPSRF